MAHTEAQWFKAAFTQAREPSRREADQVSRGGKHSRIHVLRLLHSYLCFYIVSYIHSVPGLSQQAIAGEIGIRGMSANASYCHEQTIRRMYFAYNARDLDGLTAFVREDVDWPDDDKRLHGRPEVRDYWSRQWARINVQDEIINITVLTPDYATVRISQIVRDFNGAVVSMGEFEHQYRFRDGLVERMDLRKL